jgi:hypothetical protein
LPKNGNPGVKSMTLKKGKVTYFALEWDEEIIFG